MTTPTPTENGNRVTWRDLYTVLGEFRVEINARFDGLIRGLRWAVGITLTALAIAVTIVLAAMGSHG